jgi:hypothetical protein
LTIKGEIATQNGISLLAMVWTEAFAWKGAKVISNAAYQLSLLSNNGLVALRKIEGDTYITITEKGENVSTKLLQELIAYEEFASMSTKTDYDKKFVSNGLRNDHGLERVERKLAEKIWDKFVIWRRN